MTKFILFLVIISPIFSQDTTIGYDESFDPDTLNEPPMEWPMLLFPEDTLPSHMETKTTETTEMGYRVQVVSTQDYLYADSLQEYLNQILSQSIYVVFDSPNYKVRVGDFRFRSEAEKLQQDLSSLGYKTAWIIKTPIRIKRSQKYK